MMCLKFNKREMLQSLGHAISVSLWDAVEWGRTNWFEAVERVVAYCLITLGFAAFIWGAFGGMQ